MERGYSNLESVEENRLSAIGKLWKRRDTTGPASNKPVLQQIFTHFNEFQKKRWLNTGELCSECFDYLYRRRALEQPKQSMFQLIAEPVSLSGSLLDVLSRIPCPFCLAVAHLLSPVSLSELLQWSLSQPAVNLQEAQYLVSSDPRHENRIRVRRRRAPVRNWSHVGFIEATPLLGHAPLAGPLTTMQKDFRKACGLSGDKIDSANWFRSTLVNYELIKTWLTKCDHGHSKCQAQREVSDKTGHIRLIDVIDKCIVQGDLGATYLALSYMWGGVKRLRATTENVAQLERPGGLDEVSASMPMVIKDAMTFVQSLGYRYLWADALCIIQDDEVEKHGQIAMMDRIYAAAYTTIVQHAGYNADASLPGVKIRSRSLAAITAPVRHTITGEALISMANCSVPEIFRTSPHSTRAWTLQEVLLSSRCLHFFDKQITFVCNQHYAQDWNYGRTGRLDLSPQALWEMNPLRIDHAQNSESESQRGSIGLSSDSSPLAESQIAWLVFFEVYARVFTDYRSRSLTYEADILHAFEGLGAQISGLNNGTMHYGLPSVSFDLALLWISPTLSRRKDGTFPTWSPAAWIGPATYNICNVAGVPSQPLRHCSYVKEYFLVEKGKSIVVNRQKAFQSAPSEYFRMQQESDDAHIVEKRDWPDSCLHFWSEGASFDQCEVSFEGEEEHLYLHIAKLRSTVNNHEGDVVFSFSDNIHTALVGVQTGKEKERVAFTKGEPCGILFLAAGSYHDLVQGDGADCCLILLSESRISPDARKTIGQVRMGSRLEGGLVFNVILVRRSGDFVQRLAYGRILPHDWAHLKRRREYFQII